MTWLLLLCVYPAFLAVFFGTVFLTGWLRGIEEVVLGRASGAVLRVLTAPLYGFTRVDATTVGYCTVFYRAWMADDANLLRAHESCHREQSRREAPFSGRVGLLIGAFVYGVKYLLEYCRRGYRANRFEAEARRVAGQDA